MSMPKIIKCLFHYKLNSLLSFIYIITVLNIHIRNWSRYLVRVYEVNIGAIFYWLCSLYIVYMGHPISIRILKFFCTSDNQFVLKVCLQPFSTMRILNPKVGTVPRKFEKYLWTTRHFGFFYWKIVISFCGAVVQIKNYLKTVKREKFFNLICIEIL